MVSVSDVRAKFGWTEEIMPNTYISAGIETVDLLVTAHLAEEYKQATDIQAIKDAKIMLVGGLVLRLYAAGKMPELAGVEIINGTSNAGLLRTMDILFRLADMLEKDGWRLIAPYCKPSASSGSVIKITSTE